MLELVGLLSSTHSALADGLWLRSPAVDMPKLGMGIGFMVYTMIIITVAALISRYHTRVSRVAEQQLHLQAWRLRQLVP